MHRLLLFSGVCVLLLAVETGGAKDNTKSFWEIWSTSVKSKVSSEAAAAAAAESEDFTLDTEGSGFSDAVNTYSTHADDEDFDVGSGEEEDPELIVDTTAEGGESEDTDEYYYNYKDEHKDTLEDDDDLVAGSGSGGSMTEVIVTEKPVKSTTVDKMTTRKQLTACENLRNTALQATSAFMPECDVNGGFMKQQCMVDIGMKEKNCWCVDPHGIEVTGTRRKHPKIPDCNFGENLSTCVFQRVQYSQGLLGAYKPKCTLEGDYEPIQCQGSECWCVDLLGNEITGTITNKPNIPQCPMPKMPATTVKTVKSAKTKPLPEAETGYTIPEDSGEDSSNVIVNIGPDIPIDSSEEDLENEVEETNSVKGYNTLRYDDVILKQPGLLAAIIGGAVVGLLCIVLLVMFIVYRMRKKDEGSYPLDEQKYQNYSYSKAPDKEFYA